MKSNWQKTNLDSVCNMIAGFAFKGNHFGDYIAKVIKITNIEPPFVNMQNLQGVDLKHYDVDKLDKYMVGARDFVLAMTGATIGKIGRIQEKQAYINQRVLTFQPKKCIDKDFLYYVLCKSDFQWELSANL